MSFFRLNLFPGPIEIYSTMRRIFLLVFALFFIVFRGNAQSADHVPGELIVQVSPGRSIQDLAYARPKLGTVEVSFAMRKPVVKSMGIYLLSFSPASEETKVLEYARRHPSVSIAQFNHYIESRATMPNDPSFNQQWSMHNSGQSGGTVDADIDAPEAWDITKGGLTADGDTIVVAVVDGNFSLTHEDISYFKNYDEIPNNNIDDDNNGYKDDFDGWDAYNSDGNPGGTGGSHATHCSGIVGAIGNNSKGVAGVNWNVKIMPVAGSSGVEAEVVEAYGYVRDMRALYNSSNGTKGAFVVSTNSSFGVNFGLPSAYPIWCAMYDSLGYVGVLNACATMNVNSDVDINSDIPTACPSPYMISVTNTDRDDLRNSGAAFGLTTIDLGSPGTSVYSTVPTNNYQNMTGTSMATPHVAGVIALMYAAACQDLIVNYKNNPATFALQFRDFMLNGTDSIASLQGISVTGGRLNAFNALNQVLNYCSQGGCLVPFGQVVSSLTDTSATISWGAISASDSFQLRFREQGTSPWTVLTDTFPQANLTGLSACTAYEFEIETICDTFSSGWTNTFTFASEGCCVPPSSLSLVTTGDTSAVLTWDEVYAAQSYNVRIRESGGTWSNYSSGTDTLTIGGLKACTEYEYETETVCDTGGSGYSVTASFKTSGCGACLEATYCAANLDDNDEWIAKVDLGSISNSSGSSGNGYTDFTGGQTTILVKGQSYGVTLTPGFSSTSFNEYWKVWIDWNHNGLYADAGELAYDGLTASQFVVNGFITVPMPAVSGITRMRVNMRFNTGGNPCDISTGSQFGEIEDYCVEVKSEVGFEPDLPLLQVFIHPNPATNELFVQFPERVSGLTVFNQLGQAIIYEADFNGIQANLDISAIPAGVYTIVAGAVAAKFIRQ